VPQGSFLGCGLAVLDDGHSRQAGRPEREAASLLQPLPIGELTKLGWTE
jgi:hypothetical protein